MTFSISPGRGRRAMAALKLLQGFSGGNFCLFMLKKS